MKILFAIKSFFLFSLYAVKRLTALTLKQNTKKKETQTQSVKPSSESTQF